MGKELELAIKIGGKLDRSLYSATHAAQAQLNSMAQSTNRILTAASIGVAGAYAKVAADSVKTYKDYESALNSAAATAGIERGTKEYEAMNKAARDAGGTTIKTAQESANALEYMALAGWSVEDSTKALLPVLKLSAATGADLATTSDLVTDSMANLGLGINDLNRYLDVSATANNKSNQTAMQLQEAYLGAGGVLANLKTPLEESAAILGVLANRGTKGGEAGTAFSAILVNMQKRSGESSKAMKQLGVSMYDAQGKSRHIVDVFKEISDKTAGMTEQNRNLIYQMIGGKSHVDSFAKIMQGFTTDTADGTKEVYSLIDAFKNSDGALNKLYDIKTDTLEGSAELLKSAFDDMKISIGEQISPALSKSAKDLAAKMPQISNVVSDTIVKALPPLTNLLEYAVNNSDKIIGTATATAKAFLVFKGVTGIAKGANSVFSLASNLGTLAKAAGGAKVLSGVVGTFTGVSGGAVAGTLGTIAAAAAPIALTAAAVGGVAYGLKKWDDWQYAKKYKFAEGMSEQATAIADASKNLIEYNNISKELSELRLTIANPDSSAEQLETAKRRLDEIADLVGQEYDLKINADTKELENAVNLGKAKNAQDLNNAADDYLKDIVDKSKSYADSKKNLPEMESERENLSDAVTNLSNVISFGDTARRTLDSAYESGAYESIISAQNRYIEQMESFFQENAKNGGFTNGYETLKVYEVDADGRQALDVSGTIQNMWNYTDAAQGAFGINQGILSDVDKKINDSIKNQKEFEDAYKNITDSVSAAYASSVDAGDSITAATSRQKLIELGSAMASAGIPTEELTANLAAAAQGYELFSDAVSDGKIDDMVRSALSFSDAIGASADSAIASAALIKNGFKNVSQAVGEGDSAVQNILSDIKILGEQNGLFDGMNLDETGRKLAAIAREIGLLPTNKTIKINMDGTFSMPAINLEDFIGPVRPGTKTDGSHADGLERVPFDGYIAELHKNERVLTADEASEYRNLPTIDDLLNRLDRISGGAVNLSVQSTSGAGGAQITFSPQITIMGNGDKETVLSATRLTLSEFKEFMEEYERDRRRKEF